MKNILSSNTQNMLPKFPFPELHAWYLENGRKSLPWRDYSFDEKELGYRVWLAETMLQQTQVERVKVYFENILQAFPTIENLSACSYEDFFPYYKGLGYYSRARNMLKTAQKVVSDFGGYFPKETEKLRTLSGVGTYTAEAIRAFAYDIPTLSFDTNLEKIFSRYYFGTKFQKLSKDEKEELLEQMKEFCISQEHNSPDLLRKLSPSTKGTKNAALLTSFEEGGVRRTEGAAIAGESFGFSRDINNALMDYGATISLNNVSGIDWETYPFPESKFYQTRGSLEPVIEKKESSFPTREAYVICILHENHKKYFSKDPLFSPIFIGKNSGNPRAMIQQYFQKKYHLELSVRPPEVKFYNRFEIPYIVCYAQIQSGTHDFQVFEGLKVRGFEESLVEEMEFGETLSLF